MENKEARKQIEVALGQFFLRYRYAFLSKVWDRIITHLAEEVIAIECEVKHTEGIYNETQVWHGESLWYAKKGGFYKGIEGKALAIIISQEPE